MARLPQPGGDAGNWGSILNDYLAQSHKSDGSLKDNSVTNAVIAVGAVTKADVGLNNVDNTADISKPVSTAQQTAFDLKANSSDLATKLDANDLDSQTASKITTNGTATRSALNAMFITPDVQLRDSFQSKSDGTFTTAETGQIYTRTGSNPLVIINHTMTMSGTGAGYTFADIGAVPDRFGAEVVFTAGTSEAVATLLMSKGPTNDLDNMGLHYYFSPTGWTLQLREGGELPFPELGTGIFATPLTQDGATKYTVQFILAGTTVFVKHADGSVTSHTDSRILANSSGVLGWEVFRTDVGQTLPKFTQIWAKIPTPSTVRREYATSMDLVTVAQKLRVDLTPGASNVTAFPGEQKEVSIGGGDGALSEFPSILFG
ncbi:MAG: hypothetical protein EOP49_29445, partial [Sphingobacteriales bacterium]